MKGFSKIAKAFTDLHPNKTVKMVSLQGQTFNFLFEINNSKLSLISLKEHCLHTQFWVILIIVSLLSFTQMHPTKV